MLVVALSEVSAVVGDPVVGGKEIIGNSVKKSLSVLSKRTGVESTLVGVSDHFVLEWKSTLKIVESTLKVVDSTQKSDSNHYFGVDSTAK